MMKSVKSFADFLNEGEVQIFDRIGEPLTQITDEIDALLKNADKIEDQKWVGALKNIQTLCNKLESAIAQADTKLGVINMNEAMVQVAGKNKPAGAKVLATVVIEHMMKENYLKPGADAIKKDLIDDIAKIIMESTF